MNLALIFAVSSLLFALGAMVVLLITYVNVGKMRRTKIEIEARRKSRRMACYHAGPNQNEE